MDSPRQILALEIGPKRLRHLMKGLGILVALALLLVLLPALRSVLTLIVVALFLAFLLDPVVTFLENRGVQRWLASVLVFSALVFLAIVGFKFLAPVVSNEIHELSAGLEKHSSGDMMQNLQEKLGDKLPFLSNPLVQSELQARLNDLLKSSLTVAVNILSAVVSMVMLAFVTFFFLKDGRRMKRAVVSWVPNRYFEMTLIILHKVSAQLGRYIRGQLLVSTIVGSLSVFALYLLEIRYFFFIGVLAGLANMIPYFGPIVGAVPAILVALVDKGTLGAVAGVAIAFACIQLFENVFISPVIVSRSVELHPLTIIIVIMIGGQLLGIFGMLLAVPAASIVKVTARELSWGFKNYRIF